MASNQITTPLLNALKGAPAVIFLAMTLRDGPQTTRTLCTATGYSDKVIRQSMARLLEIGLVYNDVDLHAWYLVPDSGLLHLLQAALNTAVSPAAASNSAPTARQNHEKLSTELSTGGNSSAVTEYSSAPAEEKWAEDGALTAEPFDPAEDYAAAAEDYAPLELETAVTRDHHPEEITVLAEESTATAELSSAAGEESSASRAPDLPTLPTTTTTDNTVIPYEKDSSSKYAPNGGASTKARASPKKRNSRQALIRGWLKEGGIAYRSTKMRELLAANLDPDFVKAHVLERLAWEQGMVKGIENYGVGLLVHKLTDGDPPPPMRCTECLHRPDEFGRCRCDLEANVKR